MAAVDSDPYDYYYIVQKWKEIYWIQIILEILIIPIISHYYNMGKVNINNVIRSLY